MLHTIATIIIPVFIVIAFGYLASYFGLITTFGVETLAKFAQNFALPSLLFLNISGLDLNEVLKVNLLLSFYLSATVCFVLGILGGYYFFSKTFHESIPIGFCCLFSNSILLGLPITELAYGNEVLKSNFVIVAFHAPFCYMLGILVMEFSLSQSNGILKTFQRTSLSMLSNALTLSVIGGFSVNTLGLRLPGYFYNSLELISSAGIPVALFAMGGVLTRYKLNGYLTEALMIAVIALVIHPLMTLILGNHVFPISDHELKSAVITAAMAPGVNAFLFSNIYKRSIEIAASSVILCTSLSIISSAFWISLIH